MNKQSKIFIYCLLVGWWRGWKPHLQPIRSVCCCQLTLIWEWIHGTWNTVELKVNFFFLYFSFAVPTLKIRQDIVTDVGGWLTRLCRLTRTTWSFQAGRNLCWSGRINVQFCPIFLWQQLKATLRNSVSNTATVQRRFRSLKIHSEF